MRLPFNGSYPIEQGFGQNLINYSQFNLRGHDGIDYGLPTGTQVLAPHNGSVIEVNYDPNGYGNYVKIENTTEGSVLAHLENATVSVGYQVSEGDLIGISDSSGNSTGPHLHWGYYRVPRDRSNGYNGFIDQTPFLSAPTEGIGGGVVIPTSTPIPITDVYTKEQYDAAMADRSKFWTESDILQKQVTTLTAQLTALQSERDAALQKSQDQSASAMAQANILLGFKALGYNSVDDVTLALKKKDEIILGIKTQLQQSLDRAASLADQLSKKDREDSTAIDSGIKAEQQLGDLSGQLNEITKAVGTRPGLWNILGGINFLKKAITDAETELKKLQPNTSPSPQQVKTDINWLISFLHLN